MKNLFLVCFVAIFALQASAQKALFPTKKGTVLLHVQKDGKGTVSSYSRMTITDVEGSGGDMTITYSVEGLDKNKKTLGSASPTILKQIIKDNVLIFDMKSALVGQASGANVEVSGDPMELPNKLSAGQSLKDANIIMTTKVGLLKTKTEMKMHDGKCEAVENVTVPGGSFKCYKISQSVTSTIMKQKSSLKSVSWYAEGIGVVKSESFDDKGTLLGVMELVEVK